MKGPTALKIFLSSPGDVAEEREALTKFIADFSNVTEKNYGIRLQVLTWEKDARRGPGRPQKSINELVDIGDVYIGLMGKRFGGSTGVVQSGTYEEYISAFLRWETKQLPRLRFFFKNVSISMDASEEDFEHARLIRQFKKTIQPHFFFDSYADRTELQDKVKTELEKILPAWQPQPETIAPAALSLPLKDVLIAYREFLCQQFDLIRIFQDKVFLLEDIYVSLRLECNPQLWHQMGEAEFRRHWSGKQASERMREVLPAELAEIASSDNCISRDAQTDMTIDQILAHSDRAVILGEAGSGKTTLFKHLVAKNRSINSSYLPVYLSIRDWRQYRFDEPLKVFARVLADPQRPTTFDALFIPPLEDKLQSLWRQGKVLLLLDGMDEISQNDFQRGCDVLNGYENQGNKILVSCRRSSFQPLLTGEAWWLYSINPFTREDRQQFMQKYFGAGNPVTERLAGLVEGRSRLRSLGQNPLLMGLICYIYEKSQQALPEERVVLYERCVDELLQRRSDKQFSSLSDFKKEFLRYLAFHFFQDKDEPHREWFPGDKVTTILRQMIQKRKDLEPTLTVSQTTDFLHELVEVNSLLFPVGADSYCFPHRSFQEYFAAGYLDKVSDGRKQIVSQLCRDEFWTETICLYAGLQTNATELINQLGKQKKVDLALRVIPDAVRLDWDKLDKETLNWKIRRSAVERLVLPEPNRTRLDETIDQLQSILQGKQRDPNANVRYSALIALEKIATPSALEIVRQTHTIPPDVLEKQQPHSYYARGQEFKINQPEMPPNMVFVPGSSFTMGERGDKVKVKDFFMSLFPVTNREYRRFIEAGGYQDKRWWLDEDGKQRKQKEGERPSLWDDARFNHDWQPVVGVSWYEADAYCRWLTEVMGAKPPIRLPIEEEWEYAARGPEGDEYAFGSWNEDIPRWDSWQGYEQGLTYGTARVNTVFNNCVSGFGIFDLSGNVWEWTDSWHDVEKSARLLRGGSWDGDEWNCRSSLRVRFFPVSGLDDVGFRVVQDSPL